MSMCSLTLDKRISTVLQIRVFNFLFLNRSICCDFSTKSFVVGALKNHLNETFFLSTHSIYLNGWIDIIHNFMLIMYDYLELCIQMDRCMGLDIQKILGVNLIVNIFLPICCNQCFGCSKEPSHCFC